MINIIDYVNLCSDVLLCIIDNDIIDKNYQYLFIDFSNKQIKEMFEFYLKSQLLSRHVYGKYNVVINSCNPKTNWRNFEGKYIEKYIIRDNSIKFDTSQFREFVDQIFIKLSKQLNKFKFITLEHVDIFDMIKITEKFNNCNLNQNNFNVLENGNLLFTHDNDIPNYIFQDVEIILKDCSLIY